MAYHVEVLSVAFPQDCSIELTVGRRYGLIGQNGSGKTNFLQVLANREVRSCNAVTQWQYVTTFSVCLHHPHIVRTFVLLWASNVG